LRRNNIVGAAWCKEKHPRLAPRVLVGRSTCHSSAALMAFSPQIAPSERFALRDCSKSVVAALWRSQAFDAAEKFFFADRVEIDRIVAIGGFDHRSGVLLGFVNLDILL